MSAREALETRAVIESIKQMLTRIPKYQNQDDTA